MKALPVQDETSLYKINEVNRDELMDAVMQALEERMSGWQERKANIKEEQIDISTYRKEFSEDNIKNCMEEIKTLATDFRYCRCSKE